MNPVKQSVPFVLSADTWECIYPDHFHKYSWSGHFTCGNGDGVGREGDQRQIQVQVTCAHSHRSDYGELSEPKVTHKSEYTHLLMGQYCRNETWIYFRVVSQCASQYIFTVLWK